MNEELDDYNKVEYEKWLKSSMYRIPPMTNTQNMNIEKTVTTKLMMSLYAMSAHQGFIGIRTGNNDLDLFVLNQWIRKKMKIHILIELDYEETLYRINCCKVQKEPEWFLNEIYDKYLFKNYEYALFIAISEIFKKTI